LLISACLSLCAAEPMTLAEIRGIDLRDASEDNGWVAPVAKSLAHLDANPDLRAEVERFRAALPVAGEPLPWTFAVLNAAALVDLGRGSYEAEAAFVAFQVLQADPRKGAVLMAAGTIALERDGLPAATTWPSLGLSTTTPAPAVHARIALLARKLVGRMLGTLPHQP
jgi:hypothetical protein